MALAEACQDSSKAQASKHWAKLRLRSACDEPRAHAKAPERAQLPAFAEAEAGVSPSRLGQRHSISSPSSLP